MNEFRINTKNLRAFCGELSAGDKVYLSGIVYTSRDAAHKRIFDLIENNASLPYPLTDASIYYAGPIPTPEGLPIGSCGPTTSSRMDTYAPLLYKLGVCATIGKGERSAEVCEAIINNNGIYLCAIGGAGALAAQSVLSCEVIAFDDLGCESVKKLVFNDFPLIVGIDSRGGNIFKVKT